jgi:hypothetical protein
MRRQWVDGDATFDDRWRYVRPRAVFGRHYVSVVREGYVNVANLCGGRRQDIKKLSGKSRNHFLNKIDGYSRFVKPKYLLTLTYPAEYPRDGRKVKANLKSFFSAVMGRGNYAGHDPDCRFIWKMEFQERGAPHFHILVETKLAWREFLDVCNRYWLSITHNDDDHGVKLERVRTEHGCKIYVAKHFSKGSQNVKPADFESPGKFWGFVGFGDLVPDPPDEFDDSGMTQSRQNKHYQ